jgi:nucleoside-diphosphate-sugar epimerase
MKKILLIGSNGYIGTFLYKNLHKNYNITCVDTCWFNPPPKDINIINKDFNKLPKSFIQKYDIIILLAGHSSVKMCEGEFSNAFNNNVTNFVNLLNKIDKNQKFIYASSSSVYGSVGGKTVNESYYNFKPYNQYDISKHTIDLYAEKSNIEFYGLRFGTVCGYSPLMRSDVMINAMTTSALEDNEIKLYIKDIMRPVLGINDLSRAVESIIECEDDKRGLYNLASFNKTAEQIAYEVSEITKTLVVEYEVDPTQIENQKQQTKCYNFSISTKKFKNEFNFKFNENVESITKSIVNNYSKIKKTKRNKIYDYVP